MSNEQQNADVELILGLDRIRDQILEPVSMCRAFANFLQREVGFDEAHVFIRDAESGGLENPAPDRPESDDVQDFVLTGERDDWRDVERSDKILGLPLAPRDRNLGLLIVRTFEPMPDRLHRAAGLAASVMDSALDHALTFVELQHRSRELEAIFALDHLRDEHLPFDQMVDRAAKKILDYIQADSAAVVLFNSSSQVVDIRFPSGNSCDDFERPRCLKALRDLAFKAFKLRSLISVEQIQPAIGSALCVPLILEADIIGAFIVLRRDRTPFTSHARKLLAAMASQIDTAIFEDMQRQRIRDVFSRYVAADVVDEMLDTNRDFLEGQRRKLTVLFSDLRGFTAASEQLDTDVVVRMLNEHLSAMTEVVLKNRGTLDKFIGDCVMAFWGAPVEQPDHAWLAVKTAVEMRQAHQTLLTAWNERGLQPILVGIGINTGEMFVGNIGDKRKSSYTVIGDHVNLASRLEGVARGDEILITEDTYLGIRDRVEVQAMEPVHVKGKTDAISLYSVLALK